MGKWQIRDDDGVVHSDTEEEIKRAFDFMKLTTEEIMGTYDMNSSQAEMHKSKWNCEWSGNLELVEVHEVFRY